MENALATLLSLSNNKAQQDRKQLSSQAVKAQQLRWLTVVAR